MKRIIALLLLAAVICMPLVSCKDDGLDDYVDNRNPDVSSGNADSTTSEGQFDDWMGSDETSKYNGDESYESGSGDWADDDDGWTDNY
jgi:hypothetical protein